MAYALEIKGLFNTFVLDQFIFNSYDKASNFGVDYQINHQWCYGFEVINGDVKFGISCEGFFEGGFASKTEAKKQIAKYGDSNDYQIIKYFERRI